MVNVVQAFLTTRVQYADNIDDFFTCRRNGQAHLEADYSVDTIGHIEAAIFGAAAGLKEWHHLQHSAAVARAAARPVTAAVQPVLPLAARLLNPMPPAIALVIADTLHQFLLLGVPLSPSEAKAGAVAAAEYLVRQPNIRQRIAQAGLIQNALARATTAAQAVPVGGVAQANIPLQMFALCPFDRTQ